MKRYVTTLSENNFNSIKVRLEQLPQPKYVLATSFQFHKGAIRTVQVKLNLLPILNFNSIKVRLEHTSISTLADIAFISIP